MLVVVDYPGFIGGKRISAREEFGACGGTIRSGKGMGEHDTFPREPVDIWRLENVASITADTLATQIIRKDEQDVWWVLFRIPTGKRHGSKQDNASKSTGKCSHVISLFYFDCKPILHCIYRSFIVYECRPGWTRPTR